VQAKVRQVWIAIGETGSDRTAGEPGSAKVVRVVAAGGAVEVVIVGGFESVRARAGIHSRFVNATEGLVSGDALADVEGVESQVAAVVEGEEATGDGELGVLGSDAQAGLDAFREGADVGGWEVGE